MLSFFRASTLLALIFASLGAGTSLNWKEWWHAELACTHSQNGRSWECWDSQEGQRRLSRCGTQGSLLKLLRHYETQANLNFCGVATAVMALNALEIQRPTSTIYGPYRLFNQAEFFTKAISDLATERHVRRNGISLSLMARLLERHGVVVEPKYAKEIPRQDLKQIVLDALKDPEKVVLVLYARAVLEQDGKGHWSPIAAYDAPTDSFLLLDVAKYKYPPVWVDADTLLAAMQTLDPAGRPRGLIIATKPTP